jgi:hypothetical protein
MEIGRPIKRMHERCDDSACLLKPMDARIRSVQELLEAGDIPTQEDLRNPVHAPC